MANLTKQGLHASLLDAMEFGFLAHEKGKNLQLAREEILPHIEALMNCDNLPTEILRVEFPSRHNGLKRAKITETTRGRG
jgi:predicted component of type VI protein secretion system